MNMKIKKLSLVTIIVIVVLILSGLLITRILEKQHNIAVPTFTIQNISSTQFKLIEAINEVEDNELTTTEQSTPFITPVPTSPTVSLKEENIPIAQITFQTIKKTRTYDVMADVDEDTLKKNIGHLPSSSWFGEEGLCVLMGHRDTDFSILQYVEIGDVITIKSDNKIFRYSVEEIFIVENDNELCFKVSSELSLVLVTCYPFLYSGHAPKKYVIKCYML